MVGRYHLTALRMSFDTETQVFTLVSNVRFRRTLPIHHMCFAVRSSGTAMPHYHSAFPIPCLPPLNRLLGPFFPSTQRALKQGPQLLWSRDGGRSPARDKEGHFVRCVARAQRVAVVHEPFSVFHIEAYLEDLIPLCWARTRVLK